MWELDGGTGVVRLEGLQGKRNSKRDMIGVLMEELLSAGGDRGGVPLCVRNAAGAVPMGMGHPPTAGGCCAAISFGKGFYRQA